MAKEDIDLIARISEMVGAVKAMDATGRFVNTAKYSLTKQIKDSKAYKKLGMDWETFCKERLGRDRKTIDREIEILEEFGEYFMRSVERLHLTKRDMLALHKGLPEETKAQIKEGNIPLGDKVFKVDELKENIDEFLEALDWQKKKLELAEKEKRAHEKEIRHHEKREGELILKNEELRKKVSALSPPETPEGKKERFEEQLDLVYKHLGDAGHLLNHVMDFKLMQDDRELMVKYRGAVKALTSLAENLEYKIGEI